MSKHFNIAIIHYHCIVAIKRMRKWKSLSCVRLFVTPWTIQSMEFSTGVGKPFPSPGDLPNPGIKPRCPSLQVDSVPTEPPVKPKNTGVGSLSLLQLISQLRNWTRVSCMQMDSLPAELPGKPITKLSMVLLP